MFEISKSSAYHLDLCVAQHAHILLPCQRWATTAATVSQQHGKKDATRCDVADAPLGDTLLDGTLHAISARPRRLQRAALQYGRPAPARHLDAPTSRASSRQEARGVG